MNKNREHSLPHEGSRTRGSRRITGTQDHEDHGDGSTDHLSRQTMRIKTVMNHNQENDQKNRPHDHDQEVFHAVAATAEHGKDRT